MFGSFGAGFGSFGAGVGGLLPSFTNITSWLKTPTADGKTLDNSKGADATLTGVNCVDFDGSGERVEVDSAGGVDLTTDVDNHFGACVITATFLQDFAGTQIVHSCGSASYRLFVQNFRLKVNGSSTEIFAIALNKVYRSTITYSASGQVTNFVLENLTDGTTQTDSTTRPAGSHGGANGWQIGARDSGLVWRGKISNVSVSNSSVGANLHLPLAEGSGSVAYDVSGNGANGTIIGTTWATLDGIESWNHQYGFDVNGSVKVPALNTKTTQVATFDGVADEVDFGSKTIPASESVEVVFTPRDENNRGALYSQGSVAGSFGFGITWDGVNDRIFARTNGGATNSTVTGQGTCPADGTKYKVTYDYDSSAGTVTLVLINADTGVTIETVSQTGLASNVFNVGASRPVKTGEDQANLDSYLGLIHSVKSSFIDVDFQANIGTTTVVDNSGNGNNGTVTVGSGGLDSFWGTRVADTAGSIVSADYAVGNTTITNQAGFVHNGSECGFETGLQELTATEIFAINNSTATQLFIRKDNGNVTQFFEYEAGLTEPDLTRTRAYVG